MKTATQFFPLMTVLILISIAGNVMAQGRGHHHGNKPYRTHDHDKKDHDRDRKHHWKGEKHADHHYHKEESWASHHHERPHVRHVVHHHDSHCDHVTVVNHYHQRPRYIHYSDYDVYYDFHRDVYITWSGRNWTVSTSVPVVLHRVDARHATRMEVDYEADDFPTFLQTRRPVYRRVYTGY